jgi:serine/threonine-protein kinase
MTDNTRIGAAVGAYRIESLIGRGGMSIVYLAEHVRLGRRVALKLLAPSLSLDPEFRERFAFESRRAAEVDHPNVVPIFDAGEADGQLYIAMRHIEGCDLKTLIRRERSLRIGRTLFILEQAADALDAAHERDLIHRDVKPSNILISEPAERAYLTDFGVVKHTATHGLTKTGLFLGTLDYAAPEQIEGKDVDARTDVYALGCVLYECLVGQAPFERDGELAVMHAHLVQPPPLLSSAVPSLPKGLDAVIATAMAKAKDDRYPTCGDLLAAARQATLERRTTPVSAGRAQGPAMAATSPTIPEAAHEPALAPSGPERASPPLPADAVPVEPSTATGSRGARRFRLIVGIAVIAAIASGLATYLATRASAAAPPRIAPAVTPAARNATAPVASSGPAATLVAKFDLFGSHTFVAKNYSDDALVPYKAAGGKLGAGACTKTAWSGEGPWARGRRVCFVATRTAAGCKGLGAPECSLVSWYDEPSHVAVRATVAGARAQSAPQLSAWWDAHKGDFGA